MTIDEITQTACQLILQHIKPEEVFIFGSRADDNAQERSDIDLGILCKKPIPLATMIRIEESLAQIPTLLKIDLVDFSGRSDEFTRKALQKKKVLYERLQTA